MQQEPTQRPSWPVLANVFTFPLILSVGCALLVLTTPRESVSEVEKRNLAPAPELTWEGMVDGTFTAGVEAYVADHFPLRDRFLGVHFWVKEHRGFRDERVAYYDVPTLEDGGLEGMGDIEDEDFPDDFAEDFADDSSEDPFEDSSGDALDEFESPAAGSRGGGGGEGPHPSRVSPTGAQARRDPVSVPGGSLLAGVLPTVDGAEPAPAETAAPPKKRGRATMTRGIMVYDGRAMQLFGGSPKGAPSYAKAINGYQEALQGSVNIYSIIVPLASAFHLPPDRKGGTTAERPNIDATYKMLAEGVKAVDAYSEIERHKEDYLYFRTDHHWTQLGAYYAYQAFCKEAGLEPVPLSRMEKKSKGRFLGSLYAYTMDSTLRQPGDELEYYVPPVRTTATKHGRADFKRSSAAEVFKEDAANYGVFLGGDHPLMVVSTDVATKRKALLVKNSYGNPFATFLPSHFSEVLVVDYRYFHGSLIDLIRERGVTDLIFLNGTLTANTPFVIRRIAKIMNNGAKPKIGVAPKEPPAEPSTPGTPAEGPPPAETHGGG